MIWTLLRLSMLHQEIVAECVAQGSVQNREKMVMWYGKTSLLWASMFLAVAALIPNDALAACPGDTQLEMNQCAANEYRSADKDLNAFYSKLEKSKDLVSAERAWVAYRDAECAYQVKAVEGGSMAPLVQASCLADLTKQRLKQLMKDQQN